MLHDAPPREYSVISAGIDWLTCTAKNGSPALELERLSDMEQAIDHNNGAEVVPQTWQGFEGYKLEGLFFGRREHDVMLCLSGTRAHIVGPQAIQLASNVSRLDLQVTVCTNGDEAHLGREAWSTCKTLSHGPGRPRSFSLIVGHPQGQTFYLNSRSSDNFARIYDKGAESKLAPAGLVWRYEVEFKRHVAKREAIALAPEEQLSTYVSNRVHRWMTVRGVKRTWPVLSTYADIDQAPIGATRDVLTWFEKSLRVTIAKAIKRHGLTTVLKSLGLQDHVTPKG